MRACPVILGTSFDHNEPAAYHKRDQLLDALNNRSLVIVGDSMARQAFGVLIARLRGLDVVVDYNGHYDLTYSLLRSGSRVADALWLPTLPLTQLASYREKGAQLPAIERWAVDQVGSAEQHRLRRTRVDFIWAPCSYMIKAATSKASLSAVHKRGTSRRPSRRPLCARLLAFDGCMRPWVEEYAQRHFNCYQGVVGAVGEHEQINAVYYLYISQRTD